MSQIYLKNKKIRSKNKQAGQAMLLAILFFLIISMTIVLGIATPILKQVQISNNMIRSIKSYYLSEGGLEDALYRVKNSKSIASSGTITVSGYTTTITLTTTGSGKIIDTSTSVNGVTRKMEAEITTGVGADFNYGIQTGNGGFTLAGGSKVIGNVYANGSIIATNGVSITGSAIAADAISTTTDASNNSPTPISSCTTSNCISFGKTSASQDLAESFKVSQSAPLNSISFYIKKVSSPADITVRIVSDNNGVPSATTLMTGTLLASTITTSFGWVNVDMPSTPILDPAQTYWIVLDAGTNSSKYYTIGVNSSFSGGMAKIGTYGGTWSNTSPAGLDMYFQTYLGGGYSTIGGGTYVGSVTIGTGSTGNAWAHTVSGASVAGSLYCQTGSNNNKSCNTTQPDPSPVTFPISDANIAEWETEAGAGTSGWTYQGNLTLGYQGTTTQSLTTINGSLSTGGGGADSISNLTVNGNVSISGGSTLSVGPMVVNGNLDVESKLNVKGTIWVTGTITVGSGASVSLDPTYGANSGVILANGVVTIDGGSSFSGSGQSTSYPTVITTSDCPVGPTCAGADALTMGGGSGAVVLVAQNGTLNMTGGTGAEAVTANQIMVSGGVTITYNSGLANLNFSSGPSGGYDIASWKEVQ